MNIQYVVANPSGNVTILVLNPVDKTLHSAVAEQLLAHNKAAEQVGYLTMEEGQPLRVDMMGGEFCGNASRSSAAYALMLSGQETGEYTVSCSGCDTLLTAQAKCRSDGAYDAFIEMPRPESVEAVLVDVGDLPSRFYRVDLPGIVHFVHTVLDIDHVDKEQLWQAVYDYAKDEGYEAFGLILFDPRQLKMIPAVYVTATDTIYWENSCGSGSAAVAATLAVLGKRDVSCKIAQPGGTIEIAATVNAEKELERVYIGGPVTFSDVKEAIIRTARSL